MTKTHDNNSKDNQNITKNQEAENLLKARGIFDQAKANHWRAFWLKKKTWAAWGWSYPIFDLDTDNIYLDSKSNKPVLRWKNFDKERQGGEKYFWPFGQKGCLPYYVLPGTKNAIAAADGLAFIAAGEVDVLTFVSAGFPNVFCWLNGEGSVPRDLVEVTTQLGVKRLIYLVDRDEAGEKSAQLTYQRLNNTSISFTAHRLPEFLGDKGDINDLWRSVGFNSDKFTSELNTIMTDSQSILSYPISSKNIQTKKTIRQITESGQTTSRVQPSVNWEAERNEWIQNEVMPLLNQKAPVVMREGHVERRYCPNPCHADQHPSFRISYERDTQVGIPQCSCGIQYEKHSWDMVADWVGANPFMSWWKTEHQEAHKRKSPVFFDDSQSEIYEECSLESTEYCDSELQDDEDFLEPLIGKTSLKIAPLTDDEVATHLITVWNGQYAYFYDRWNVYEGGVWIHKENIERLIWDQMKQEKVKGFRPSKAKASSIEACLRADLFISNSDIDRSHDYINLYNGLFNITTGLLEEHNRERYLTTQLEFGYDPQANCPTWLHFLSQSLVTTEGKTDKQLINLLQEAIGYSLTSDTHHEVSFWLYGPAASGKSTVIKVLQALLGNAFMSIDLNMLDKNHYQLAHLPGKRVAACSEVKTGGRLADSILKTVISGEEIVARQIYAETISFKPIAKIWWAMNEQPENLDRSNAIYRRLKIIPFNRSVPLEDRDLHLINKLQCELPGIFNWALEGLRRLRMNDGFTQVEQVDSAIRKYQTENDTEAVFLNDIEWCVLSPNERIQSSILYMAYKAWAERFGHDVKSSTKIANDWERLGLKKIKMGSIFYTGITLTKEALGIVEAIKSKTPAYRYRK